MKKKTLEKIIKKSISDYESNKDFKYSELKKSEEISQYQEYDEYTSNQFMKIYKNLLKYPDNISINISSNSIHLSTQDIKSVKKNTKSITYNEDLYLEISVIKNIGFSMNKGYSYRCFYEDKGIFDSLYETTKLIVKEKNQRNFKSIIDVILLETGIMRDNNLDEIFKSDE